MNARQRRAAKRHPKNGVRHNPKKVGHPVKIGVEKGRGPRHADNSKEGEDLTQVDTDTVPAMLTPREAVLNRNAAEMAGRGNIEALNEKGNLLAKRGVDLAAEGDEDVTRPDSAEGYGGVGRDERMTLGPKFNELIAYLQYLRRFGVADERIADFKDGKEVGNLLDVERAGHNRRLEELTEEGYAGGTSDMKSRQKLAGGDENLAYPARPPQGAFPGRGPGGVYPSMPGLGGGAPPDQIGGFGGGLGARDEFGRQFSQRNEQGGFGRGHGVPDPNAAPPGYERPPTPGGPQTWGPMPVPVQGVQPAVPPQHWSQMPSSPFYPPGQGLRMAQGEEDILGNAGSIYGSAAPVSLSAPSGLGDIVKAITAEGQKQGLNAQQIAGILKMVQGMGGTGAGGGIEAGTDPVGYSGGISEVGYAPGIAPGASFDYDKGGWVGRYDPRYNFPVY